MWNGIVQQYDTDYLWQKPPCVCTEKDYAGEEEEPDIHWTCNCQWLEDNGLCIADQEGDPDLAIPCIKYFPMRPQVEPRCSEPELAPIFVEHLMGCATDFTNGCPDKPICNPPVNTGYLNYNTFTPTTYLLPYSSIYLAKQACICANGRWAEEYEKQRISCTEEEI